MKMRLVKLERLVNETSEALKANNYGIARQKNDSLSYYMADLRTALEWDIQNA